MGIHEKIGQKIAAKILQKYNIKNKKQIWEQTNLEIINYSEQLEKELLQKLNVN